MKIFTLEWWLNNTINSHCYMMDEIGKGNIEKAIRYAKIANYSKNRIIKNYHL